MAEKESVLLKRKKYVRPVTEIVYIYEKVFMVTASIEINDEDDDVDLD